MLLRRWAVWQVSAVALAAAASAVLCVVPVIRRSSGVSSSDGTTVVTEQSLTLLAEQGPGVLVVLAVPVLLLALPLLLRHRAVVLLCGGVLGVLVVVTGFSVGLYYAPALLLALAAIAVRDGDRPPSVLPVEGRWAGY